MLCVSRCVSVCHYYYCKSNQPISLKLGCYDWAYQWESINFWWRSSPGYFPQHSRLAYFRRCIGISRTVTGRFSRHSATWLTLTRKLFWKRSGRHRDTDQSENPDSNPGSLWLRLDALAGREGMLSLSEWYSYFTSKFHLYCCWWWWWRLSVVQ